MSWNFNIDEAPKGRTEQREKTVKGKVTIINVFIAEPCMIATKCEKVFESYALKNGRWLGLATNERPLAWQPKPLHPKASPLGGNDE